jgi:hypothetical protein
MIARKRPYRQQRIGAVEVVEMARRQVECDRIAERIAQGVLFGAHSAFAPVNGDLGVVRDLIDSGRWLAASDQD